MKTNFKKKLISSVEKKRCRYCLTRENLTYDHKVPLAIGGKNLVGNIQVLCKSCNSMKSSMSDGQFRNLARWVYKINKRRESAGKRPFGIRKDELGVS